MIVLQQQLMMGIQQRRRMMVRMRWVMWLCEGMSYLLQLLLNEISRQGVQVMRSSGSGGNKGDDDEFHGGRRVMGDARVDGQKRGASAW